MFNCNAALNQKTRPMSLNRCEQALFAYWDKHPEERRHWQARVGKAAPMTSQAGERARTLERELWEHFVERSAHVPTLGDLREGGLRRVSLLNLAEHIIRLWGPPPPPRHQADQERPV